MTSQSNPLETAVGLHQAGRLHEASAIYQRILAAEPRHADVLHLLGLIAHQTGDHEQAIELITRAIRIDGGQSLFHSNLGEAYRAANRLPEAKECYLRAIELAPEAPQPYFNLALLHRAEGDSQATVERCRQAVALEPKFVEAHRLLATALAASGDLAGAQAVYGRTLAIRPDDVDTLVDFGRFLRQTDQYASALQLFERAVALRPDVASLHVSLGDLKVAEDQWHSAVESYQKATLLDPQSPVAHMHLAAGLHATGKLEDAVTHYRKALEQAPDYLMAHYNLGTALEGLGRCVEAMAEYEAALELEPTFADARINLGACYQERGDARQALVHFERVLDVDPDSPQAHFNRALNRLSQGDLKAGWPDYEWRAGIPGFPIRTFDGPRYDGSAVPGKTLLVHSEQGLGDTLQFIRYAPLVRQRVGRAVWLVQPEMLPLLRQSGYDEVVGDESELPHIDVHAPMMSLPGLLGTTLANLPTDVPYLSPDPALVDAWRERLQAAPHLRVGICWQGSPTLVRDQARSIPLAEFAPLACVPGVHLVSLQKGAGGEQLDALAGQFEVFDLRPAYDTESGAFMNAAAVMRNLDLVITVDTAIAHLAGALAVPVWVLLPAYCDWRWLLDREDSPWYPTMRLFRRARDADWAEVFARVATALRDLAGSAAPDAGTRPD